MPIVTGDACPVAPSSTASVSTSWPALLDVYLDGDAVSERILDAAAQEFAASGIKGASMTGIGAEALVSRATLYRRFPDKDSLAQAYVAREALRVLEEVSAALMEVSSVDEGVAVIAVTLYRTLREHPVLSRIISSDSEIMLDLMRGGAVELGSTFIRLSLGHLDESGRAAGDPAVAAEVITRLLLTHLLVPAGRISIDTDEAVRELAERYLVPIYTGRGRKAVR